MTSYKTLRVKFQEPICFIQFYRPESNNTINNTLINEFMSVLDSCNESITIIVIEGLPETFCFGADFQEIQRQPQDNKSHDPEPLYDLWLRLATAPYITISHVRGRVNAGGMGFVAASDIVLADATAQFSLSELLFGLLPACVMPFLVRRIGFQKANFLTLMTQPITVQQAATWGLVDAYEAESDQLLKRNLHRLKKLPKHGIARYKKFMRTLYPNLSQEKNLALSTNKEMFSNPQIIEKINRFVAKGLLPWE